MDEHVTLAEENEDEESDGGVGFSLNTSVTKMLRG